MKSKATFTVAFFVAERIMSFIQVDKISKSYENQPEVLKEATFNVEKGEIVVILGESGCGKSTLLNVMAGWLPQDSGRVYIDGQKLKKPEEQLMKGHNKIKFVEQKAELLPNHSVYDNITFKLRSYVKEFQDERVEQLLELTNLKGLEERIPRELSGGQIQRLAIACALADEPWVILFDEPFSNLDNANRLRLLYDLKYILKEEGITSIFVTHSGEEASFLADRILVMKEGSIVEEGTAESLYNEPTSVYTAGFFGYNNFIDDAAIAKALSKDKLPKLAKNDVYSLKAEHLSLSKKKTNCSGKIQQVDFIAGRYIYIVEVEKEELLVLSTEKNFKVGDKVYLEAIGEFSVLKK